MCNENGLIGHCEGQGAQQSVEKWGFLVQSGRGSSASRIWSVAGTKEDSQLLNPVVEKRVEPSFQEQLERQLAAWRRNSAWVDETPALEVGIRDSPPFWHEF